MASSGSLFIVATPIGNMQDITLRALEILQSADLVLAEDTRRTGQLLSHYNIHKPMLSFHDHNENQRMAEVIEKLKAGQTLALVSDAGTPLVSDPGYKLVRECIAKGIKVESIPGPSAAIVALTVSGLPPDKFLFIGFLPEKQSKRQKLLKSLIPICHSSPSVTPPSSVIPVQTGNFQDKSHADPRLRGEDNKSGDETGIKATIILYESPYHLKKTLAELESTFGDIQVVICRELTKMHEETFRGTVEEALAHFLPAGRHGQNPKGEFVILF